MVLKAKFGGQKVPASQKKKEKDPFSPPARKRGPSSQRKKKKGVGSRIGLRVQIPKTSSMRAQYTQKKGDCAKAWPFHVRGRSTGEDQNEEASSSETNEKGVARWYRGALNLRKRTGKLCDQGLQITVREKEEVLQKGERGGSHLRQKGTCQTKGSKPRSRQW